MVRLHYLDNLRWISILVLFPTHAAFVFCAGWYGYCILSDQPSDFAHLIAVSVEPWIMPLLFVIAGMSTGFSLRKRTPAMYLKERVMRLLVPFLAGIIFVCPVIAYYALRFHTGYTGSFAEAFVHFFISITASPALNGITGDFSVDHLWFIIVLFVVSVLALGVILGGRVLEFHPDPGRFTLLWLVLLCIPVWLLDFVGINEGGYSLVAYFAIFLFGYCIFASETVLALIEEYRVAHLAAWIALTIGVMGIGGILLDHGEVFWGTSFLHTLTGWMGVLALMGMGRHYLNRSTPLTAYLTASSYPVYIIHQAAVVALAYYIVAVPVAPFLQYVAIVVLSLVLTLGAYEVIRRIPGVRWLIGIGGPVGKKGE
ncbi:MAG: Glucans biosynthesis protein C [Methanoregula sp. SKADARSKE-2]|nr:MAG: Glucans biosynthesis protein C [Methanoregula sp. SKADARSKE-2]